MTSTKDVALSKGFRRLRRFGVLAVIFFSASASFAQAQTSLGWVLKKSGKVEEFGPSAAPAVGTRLPFQVFRETTCPASSESCILPFPPTPSTRRREIENISCVVETGPNASLKTLALVSFAPSGFASVLVPTATSTTPTSRSFSANEQIKFFQSPGGDLVGVAASSRQGFVLSTSCGISGTVVVVN